MTIPNQQLSTHFSLFELCQSSSHPELVESLRRQALTTPYFQNLQKLCTLLETIRVEWLAPIKVNSGLRSKALNTLIGGATHSEHLEGCAADLDVGTENEQLFELIQDMCERKQITVGQLIQEHAGASDWIHVSTPGRFKNEFLRYNGKAYSRVYAS